MSDVDQPQPATAAESGSEPRRRLSLFDTTNIIVGIIIGASIFEGLPFIAWNLVGPSHEAYGWYVALTSGSRTSLTIRERQEAVTQGAAGIEYELVAGAGLRFSWALGGLIAMIGALCFAELATAYPEKGGIYAYLTRAFGRRFGLAFVWLEFLLIRPGNLGAIAFVAAVYMQKLFPLTISFVSPETIWAVVLVGGITGLNLFGFTLEKWMQNGLTITKLLGLAAVVFVAWNWTLPPGFRPPSSPMWQAGREQSFAVAMTVIMFAYGGWSDVVYVAAEVREPKKNLFRSLFVGIIAVSAIYLVVVDAFLYALPFRAIRNGDAVAAELMYLHFGPWGSVAISALVVVSCLGALHGMLFTSSRAFFAAGRQHHLVGWFGKWNERLGLPARALVSQGILTLALIAVLGQSKGAFQQMVNFTGPFYNIFLVLVAIALIVLRRRDRKTQRTYAVPFYPFTPIVFALTGLWLCYASTRYLINNLSGWQWVWTAAVILSAVVALILDRPRSAIEPPVKLPA